MNVLSNEILTALMSLILVGLVYFAATYIIGTMRAKKSATDQIRKHKIRHDDIKTILANSYRIENTNEEEELDPEKTKEILRKLEKSTARKDHLLGRMLTKIQYTNPDKTMRSMVITYIIIAACATGISISLMGLHNLPMQFILSLPSSLILYNSYINYVYNQKIKRFLDNFIYALDIISRGARSGLMLNDCFKLIAEETDASVAEQFQMMLHDMRIGLSLEQVMGRFSNRIPLKEVRFFAVVISIQAKTGGNLAEVIDNLATILRQRKSLLLKIQTLSQEAKTSAGILMSLPILIIILLSIIGKGYMDPLIATTTGHYILGFAGFWMMCGVMIMRKMINFYR